MSWDTKLDRLNTLVLRRFGVQQLLDGAPVQGDFVKPGKTFTLSDGIPVMARVPTLVVADGDVPADPVGKAAVCDGLTYTVEECCPDGFGLTVLELKKAPA